MRAPVHGVPPGWARRVACLLVSAAAGCAGSPPNTAASVPETVGLSGTEATATTPSGAAASSTPTAVVNQPPDFELDTLQGDSVRLRELVGKKVILLDFWATYCDPCLAAMPHLQQLYDKYQARGFVVLGISIDGPESAASVRSTVSKLGVHFPILLDDESRVVAQYNSKTSAPFSVLIGRDGAILAQQEGFTTGNAAALDLAVERALQ